MEMPEVPQNVENRVGRDVSTFDGVVAWFTAEADDPAAALALADELDPSELRQAFAHMVRLAGLLELKPRSVSTEWWVQRISALSADVASASWFDAGEGAGA